MRAKHIHGFLIFSACISISNAATVPVPPPITPPKEINFACEGILPKYENGFGTSNIDMTHKIKRLVRIDTKKNTVIMTTLFGDKLGTLNPANKEFYAFSLEYGVPYQNSTIVEELVKINQISGEIDSTYQVTSPQSYRKEWMAFSGSCVKIEKPATKPPTKK